MAGAEWCIMLYFLQVRQRAVASFLNPDLTNKSWDVHLYCALMAGRDGCLTFQGC